MKAFIDNKIVRHILSWDNEEKKNIFLEACRDKKIIKDNEQLQFIFNWPSLLEYLDCPSIFENFPKFDSSNQLFNFILSAVEKAEKDVLVLLYDHVFAECLTEIKALSQVNPTFLIEQIRKKQQSPSYSNVDSLVNSSLSYYEKLLLENPSNSMHDLILYLAWDRVCVNFAIIFEFVFPNQNPLKGLEVLKECLSESFQHITGQGRTSPGFFRLGEAFYAYQLREENLQIHTDAEWSVLCQSSCSLKPREDLSDVCYVDEAIMDSRKLQNESVKVFTMDSEEKVKATLSLTNYMIDKLKKEEVDWRYTLGSAEIICLKEVDANLLVTEILRTF